MPLFPRQPAHQNGPPMSKPEHLSDLRFADLDLHETLQQGLAEAGFEYCSPIQAESLPLALAGKDVAGQAQTGTGKSAAFLLATMQRLLTREPHPERPPTDPRCLILAPTRELAIQIAKDGELLGKHTGLKMTLLYGGAGYDQQREALAAGTDILIATPGRMIDFYKQNLFTLHGIEVVVLDEADRMFDLGFIKDIRYVLRRMPAFDQRLNLLFSATLSQRVMELAYEHMNDPTGVKIETDNVTADNVRQIVYYPANEEKIPLLVHMIRTHAQTRSIIFVNTKRVSERLDDYLNLNGIEASVISGDVPQKKREKILQRFKEGDLPVLIATDVAARGLHIPDVTHVFNFDLPEDPEDYVHRIGRTARAGAEGDAISFACEDYAIHLPDIEKYIEHRIESGSIDYPNLPELKTPPRRPRKPRGGKPGGGRPGGGSNRSQGRRSGAQGGNRRR